MDNDDCWASVPCKKATGRSWPSSSNRSTGEGNADDWGHSSNYKSTTSGAGKWKGVKDNTEIKRHANYGVSTVNDKLGTISQGEVEKYYARIGKWPTSSNPGLFNTAARVFRYVVDNPSATIDIAQHVSDDMAIIRATRTHRQLVFPWNSRVYRAPAGSVTSFCFDSISAPAIRRGLFANKKKNPFVVIANKLSAHADPAEFVDQVITELGKDTATPVVEKVNNLLEALAGVRLYYRTVVVAVLNAVREVVSSLVVVEAVHNALAISSTRLAKCIADTEAESSSNAMNIAYDNYTTLAILAAECGELEALHESVRMLKLSRTQSVKILDALIKSGTVKYVKDRVFADRWIASLPKGGDDGFANNVIKLIINGK